MPLITVLAPGTPVVVNGMALPGAVIERVDLRSGVNPLLYHVAWREGPDAPVRRATFRGDRVTEIEAPAGSPAAASRLADLGAMFAAETGGP